LSIFEGAKLARAIITTATTPYAIGIDSKIFRYFFGSAIISNGCLSALSRIGIGKTSMAETNRKSEYEYALMHLRLRGRHGWMKAAGAFNGLPRELRTRDNMRAIYCENRNGATLQTLSSRPLSLPQIKSARTDGAVHQAQAALRCARRTGCPSKWAHPCLAIDACAPCCNTPCNI
jgi:hypothetical protein